MTRDDTFPLPEERVRSFFQNVTTKEAVYHAETIWPFLDAKISAMLEEKVKDVGADATREALFKVISDLLELNPSSIDDRRKIKRLFRLLYLVMAAQSWFARICFRCILPWTAAALVGIIGIALKQYFPTLATSLQRLGLPDGP